VRVFISWSGDSSRHLAQGLNKWIRRMLQTVQPFFSENAIAPGSPWLRDLLSGLTEQDFFVACVTPESHASPWFNFEAGIAAGTLFSLPEQDSGVCPVLYGLTETELPMPLGMFQAVRADEEGFRKLVKRINGKLETKLTDDDLTATFNHWWPELQEVIASMPAATEAVAERPTRDILEEVLTMARQGMLNSTNALFYLERLEKRVETMRPILVPTEGRNWLDRGRPSTFLDPNFTMPAKPASGDPLGKRAGAYQKALEELAKTEEES
jgi:hypothetical protein